MGGPGRLVRARRDRDRTALAVSVRPTRKPKLLFRLFVVFLLRLAERRFRGSLFQEPPRTTWRQGALQASGVVGWIKASAPEDRVAQAPRICMLSVSDPRFDVRIDFINLDCS